MWRWRGSIDDGDACGDGGGLWMAAVMPVATQGLATSGGLLKESLQPGRFLAG
jgi:hypothetical protein